MKYTRGGRKVAVVEHMVSNAAINDRRIPAGQRPIFAVKGGRYLMRGLWYGKRNPTSVNDYGKVEGQAGLPIGKIVGNRVSPFLRRKMCD
jgi:hypothetical protein